MDEQGGAPVGLVTTPQEVVTAQPGAEQALGARLQEVRRKGGLTQQQLCQKANLSYSTLAKIERGAIRSPSIFTIQSIAAALGTSLDELVGSGGTPQPQSLSKTKSGVSFIYFDVNGCLVRFYQRAFARLAEDVGVPADVVETAFWHFNEEACRGTLSATDFNQALASRIGVETVDWQQYYLEAVEPIAEMNELLSWAAEHYRVGLLTNIMSGLLPKLRSAGKVPAVDYAAIIDSSVVGITKPDPAIYKLATDEAGVPSQEILLVDDTQANVVTAEKQGWNAMWFDYSRPEESVARLRDALTPAA